MPAVTDGDKVGSFGLTPLVSTGEINQAQLFFSFFFFIIPVDPGLIRTQMVRGRNNKGVILQTTSDAPMMHLES